MEKVWRPFSVWERRPVIPLNGAISSCFRKKTTVFVNKCKTGNSVPFLRQQFGALSLPAAMPEVKSLLETGFSIQILKTGTAFA